jgi:pimeloyl-ACP methyl ester carboxylesterase
METTECRAEINGIEIYYRVYGEGDPLLLIMGLGGNIDWWDERFLQPLAERFQVVAFDNRGAGRSGTPEGPYPISLMASDTLGLLDHLGWKSAHILGFSMGGMIAQELACTHPERVSRLVLICTNCGGQEKVVASPEVLSMLYTPRGNLSDEAIVTGTLYLLFPPEYIESNPEMMDEVARSLRIVPTEPHCYMAQLDGANSWSIYPRLCDLNKPTLIIAGGEDILIPPQNSRILAEVIPDNNFVEIPEAGHGITFMFPEEVAHRVLGFLA